MKSKIIVDTLSKSLDPERQRWRRKNRSGTSTNTVDPKHRGRTERRRGALNMSRMSAGGTHELLASSLLCGWQKPSTGQCSDSFIQHYPLYTVFSYVHLTQKALCLSLLSCTSTLHFCNALLSLFRFVKSHLILFCRTQDIKTKKHHIPLVDRTPLEPPPVVVVVMGPPKVGKSTLIRCLIKNYTRQKLSDICGPVTIVSG